MQNFQTIAKVGEGAFASVYKVKRKQDGMIYAMKKIKISTNNPREIQNCLNEVRILASISNPYIIGYKDAIYEENTKEMLLVTEFAYGGDLSGYIKDHMRKKMYIPEQQIWRKCIQALHGLRALHKLNIFHRDIKSANILLTENYEQVKLGDLNVSKISKSGLASTQAGTPYYASPEVWSDLPYTSKCDVWSLGCVLYEMASFRPPFTASNIETLKKKIIVGHYDRIPSQYSQQLESFIRLCLTTNAKQRPSVEGLLHNTIVRKKIYMFPNEKFAQSSYEQVLNKQNKLLQTIKIPNRLNFGNDIKNRLPKSNYESTKRLLKSETQRNKSLCIVKERSEEKLPEIIRRNSSRDAVKDKCNVPRPRLVYLR